MYDIKQIYGIKQMNKSKIYITARSAENFKDFNT